MVKLYSNENFPMDIVRQLRQLSYAEQLAERLRQLGVNPDQLDELL